MAQASKDVAELSKAMAELTNQFKRAGIAAAATGALFGGLMTRTAKLFSPAEALRFEYRLRDLGAVIGSVLQPSFEKLSNAVRDTADWLYNLDEGTKKTINAFVTWTIPITAASIALGGLAGMLTHLGVALKAVWAVLSMAGLGFASLFRSKGKGGGSVASLAPTPVFIVGAAPGVFAMGGGGIGGTPTQVFNGKAGKAGMSTGMKIGVGLAVAGGVAGAAFAGGENPGEDLMMAGSAALGGLLTGGPLMAVIAGGLTLLTSQFMGWWNGTKDKVVDGPKKSSQDIAPREVQSFSSVLDPGRRLRMQSLATAGPPKADESTMQARAQATLDAINNAQQRVLNIWTNLGKVMEQQAQNNLAR